ncbi:MAG: sigma-70 family RNA polymerase sigma factor [Polyangiaceae bacterium]
MSPADTRATIHSVFQAESARVVASLARLVRDVGLAEELAQDALVSALEEWPSAGVPENPGAWLMTTAKNRALNALRREKMLARKHEEIGRDPRPLLGADAEDIAARIEASLDDDIGDERLALMFTACHPLLSTEGRVALTLRLIAGLTTEEIARAFLVPESTVAQRIVRAKKTLAERKIAFEVPRAEALGPRLASVLEVVYLVFNEGYAATSGDDVLRPALVGEAIRLAQLLARLAPAEPEVHGLVALLELSSSRALARTDEAGEPVLLLDQDRTRWDSAQIARGLASLARAEELCGSGEAAKLGPYALQAAISACHARARTAALTDWTRIAALYADLLALVPSPVVALNHAVAVSMAEGPARGLELLDELSGEPSLARYHLLPSARADMLERLGRHAEARAAFERAASMTENARQRARLLARAARA